MSAPAEEFGPYLVYEQIGLGGMASVHRAETRGIAGFRRPIALKRMLPGVAANADSVQAFIREARLASHLRHANCAQTYDLGKVGDIYFIAMELVIGRTLREILKRASSVAGAVPLPIALNILGQICDALDYAHNLSDDTGQPLGIIHRDVSPSNIIVSESGVVKLIDFGIAKASALGMQTMSRTIKGKFAYMAPEYLGGQIDARADLFALGVLMHELLSNQPLFLGAHDMETLFNVKTMTIDPPSTRNPKVPPEIDSIVMTALARDPNLRWQRASALRNALATEVQRLGLGALDHQVIDWVTRAFREVSEPSISIRRGTVSGPELDVDDDLGDLDTTTRRPNTRLATPIDGRDLRPAVSAAEGRPGSIDEQAAPPRPEAAPVAVPAAPVAAPAASPRTSHAALIVVLLLALAAGTAVVVYFGWPYFT